jgi:hypothetical protein
MKKGLLLGTITVICLFLALIACQIILEVTGMDRISLKSEASLRPIILYVDGFIQKHHRLPTQEEFHATADKLAWMVEFRDRTYRYAASHGAKNELDYMIGIWRADWFHYYKSWDQKFINAADEFTKNQP